MDNKNLGSYQILLLITTLRLKEPEVYFDDINYEALVRKTLVMPNLIIATLAQAKAKISI
jgi:hypothetical protein